MLSYLERFIEVMDAQVCSENIIDYAITHVYADDAIDYDVVPMPALKPIRIPDEAREKLMAEFKRMIERPSMTMPIILMDDTPDGL